jgi:hypothetical protein
MLTGNRLSERLTDSGLNAYLTISLSQNKLLQVSHISPTAPDPMGGRKTFTFSKESSRLLSTLFLMFNIYVPNSSERYTLNECQVIFLVS